MKLTSSEPDVRTIVQRIDADDIDLQPDFQRQEVWSTPKKRRLIDTILRGWSIPPVHLVEISQNRLEVLDGQQRLTAIRDFVHNKFSIDGRITPIDAAIERLNGRFYEQLDSSVRRLFDQYPIRCFKITDYLPEEPSELFYRLNQPTALTAGEQRNALFGPARQQLKEIVSHFERSDNSKDTLSFSNARLAYDDIIARLLFFLEQRSFGVKSTEARVSERFRDKTPFSDAIVARSRAAVDLFSSARGSAEKYRYNKASVLSLLLFYSRFSEQDPDPDFLQSFIRATKRHYTAHFITEAAAEFEDRASLRVTDVASVVYRDFTLWYVYFFVCGDLMPAVISQTQILNVESALLARDEASFEEGLRKSLDIETWAGSL